MKKLVLTAALGAASLGLAACGDGREDNRADANASAEGEAIETDGGDANAATAAGGAAASASFPKGARIVDDNGVTYRVDADGTRIRLGDTDSRIVVENGVRYRVDPGGARVRINTEGAAIDVDGPDIDLPDVDVGINEKGNPDIDVGDKDPDGGR